MLTSTLPRPFRSLRTALALALLVGGAAACGDDDEPDAGSADTTEAEAPDAGDDGSGGAAAIEAVDFSLSDLTVAPGAEIVLDNQGSAPHTATADDGAFDTGQVSGGSTSDPVTAPDEPGEYAFHCEIHPDMTATLTVEG
jgi:plastocyanin